MKLLLPLLLVALLLAGTLFALGWIFSSRFLVPAPYGLLPEFEVLGFDGERVTLPAPPERARQFARTDAEGAYGLVYEGGHGRLGAVLEHRDGRVVRPFELVSGEPPRAGAPARLDVTLFRRDPQRDHGLPFEEVRLEGRAGTLAAWWLPGDPERAVLMLHGRRRADRTEALRALPTVAGTGASVLVLAYRNHDASDPSRDGLFHYGLGEHEDALAALGFLRERGAERAALMGYSMGGAVALEALERWPETGPEAAGLVLDSPLLDTRTVIRHGARGLPLAGPLADLALWVGRLRTGTSWRELDQRRTAGDLEVPVLLFAGTADSTVPIALADEFAAGRRVSGSRSA